MVWWSLFDEQTRLFPLLCVYILVTALIVYWQGEIVSECLGSMMFLCFSLLVIPSGLLIQLIFLYCYELSMQHIDRLSQIVLAIFAGFVNILLVIILTVRAWRCSTIGFQLIYFVNIFLNSSVCIIYLRSLARNFLFTGDSQAKQSLLLLVRCSCLTTRFKKITLVSPYFIASFSMVLSVRRYWDASCSLPYQSYGVVSSATLFLMGITATMLLHYGRRRIHLLDSSEQLVLSSHSESSHSTSPLARSQISSSPASDLIALAKDSQRCLPLTLLWYLAGGINVFGFLWSLLGLYWSSYQQQCDRHLVRILIHSETFLFLYSILGGCLAWLVKIESCFPTPLDPSHFHSQRTGYADNDSESDSPLAPRILPDQILQQQYERCSKISQNRDIELGIAKKSTDMNISIADSTRNTPKKN